MKTKTLFFAVLFLNLSGFGNLTGLNDLSAQNAPTMGWSSWNHFGININETLIRQQADAMISSGMYDAGYRFINIDDGYFGGRDTDGNLLENRDKFPSGMGAIAAYIHAKGLKAGIYTDAGNSTCASMWNGDTLGVGVGIYGHLEQDCNRFFTQWGYDFLKVDWCGGDKLRLSEPTEYLKIIAEVRRVKSEVIFNICRWQFPGEWAITKADSWRVSGDIEAKFSSILHIIDLNADLYKYASAGHYNDMDMLQVGRGMTYEEDKTHFSMWCMLVSPLLAGNDLRTMSSETIEILTNREIIALNQDKLFRQAQRIFSENGIEIWEKPLADGSRAFAIMNRNDETADFQFAAEKFSLKPTAKIRDLWQHRDLGKIGKTRSFTIAKHGVVVFKTVK
ncbi:MAG: glycoside hydrolase family 27 protein [Paludibacter sp.]|jgi:hypothetical protein|nr:glycoside hydrolase family 27 protein [Paludibacter sp.]